ncbi:unnamed protein product [Adineta ricciae]|uniref:Uncharacterized protein n=1 Tax=Adineta ricciae TaxID=249248 RepID=A0A814SVE1_ADIRI|nr:unnamed protein product [Adineta ricciae]
MLPITAVKGKDSSTDDNERKKSQYQQRDMIIDLLKHYSTATLDMKYFQDKNNRIPFARCRTCLHTRTIYDFELEDLDLKKQSLSKYRNQLCLIVNVATF